MNNKILIALEGADCAGKSSVINRLKSILPIMYPDKKFLFTREPGNLLSQDNESEKIRQKLLHDDSLTNKEQAKLFAKSRLYHTKDIIDKINEGYIVLTDRFLLSSYIYQGENTSSKKLLDMNRETCKLLNDNNIHLETIVFKITEDTYNNRMNNRKETKDVMEDVNIEQIYNRINKFNAIDNKTSLININNNNVSTIDANGNDYSRILIDVLYQINITLNEN